MSLTRRTIHVAILFPLLLSSLFFRLPIAQAMTNCNCTSAANDCRTIIDVTAGGCSVDACVSKFGKDFTSPNPDVGGTNQSACDAQHKTSATASISGSKSKNFITPLLNVTIPGLIFTNAVSGSCTSEEVGQCIKSNFLADYLNAIYKWMIGIGVTIAIVMIMIGGFQYTLSAGGSDIGKARSRIGNAIVGLVLLICTYLILNVVNPQLTNLKTVELQNIPLEEIDMIDPDV